MALEELDILEEVGLAGPYLVVVHADSDPDMAKHEEIARRGAWLSYDGIREGNASGKVPLVVEALRRWPEQVLISQDAGWYHVGEPGGGDIAALDWLPREFLPMLAAAGVGEAEIRRVMVDNPARAFAIRQGMQD